MPFTTITSLSNARIKGVLKLRERTARDASGLTIIEGARELAGALAVKVDVTELYVCPDFFRKGNETELLRSLAKGTTIFEVTKKIFEKISYGERQEGILAIGRPQVLTLNNLRLKENPFLVVIETIEKPGNLGAILRTCDGAGVDGVIACDAATDIYNPNVIRASLGTVFSVPVAAGPRDQVLKFLQKNKIGICSATPLAKKIYTQANLQGAVAIVMGSEQKGLSDFWLSNSSLQIKIPMRGKADSLNVAATAAILIYEAIRQRSP